MQPIGYDALAQGFDAELSIFARALTVNRSGKRFDGVIDAAPAFIPDSLLGEDPREVGALEIRQDAIQDGDIVQGDDILQDGIATWKVVKRDNNPADFKIKFWLVKIVTSGS